MTFGNAVYAEIQPAAADAVYEMRMSSSFVNAIAILYM